MLTLYKTFVGNVLLCKVLKFKSVCIAMRSLVMGPFSRYFLNYNYSVLIITNGGLTDTA